MREEDVDVDVTVVGGGLAGVSAAIAAARVGARVALVQNRPVLGGNSSSEVRVWVCGATAHGVHQFARETGIMGELFVENQFRNPEGNPIYWDLVVLEAVRSEPNIQLFLNTDVRDVAAADGPSGREIKSATGWMMGSERVITFHSPVFIDCTGDGLLGFLAGAEFRIGRESRALYGESLAPQVEDDVVMGSTIVFYTKDIGRPVKFVPPTFAKDIATTSIPERRIIRSGDNGAAYWWIEWGGELDTVHDNERIRDELWSVIYGIWDYIKNSGKFDAETMTLEWVGAVPGKREYRRFVGDYTLSQEDLTQQRQFADRIAFGGWSIDLHYPEGVYAKKPNEHWYTAGVYHVPVRCLYSTNVANLFFAGRNISASHVAFGSTRVMATCATLAQAAGSAAALAAWRGVPARSVAGGLLDDLHLMMLREDASIIGVRYADPADLARSATVVASNARENLALDGPSEAWQLTADVGLVLPVDPNLSGVSVLLDAHDDTAVEVQLHDTGLGERYRPDHLVSSASARVARGARQWVDFDLQWTPESPRNAFLLFVANPAIALHVAPHPPFGVVALEKKAEEDIARRDGLTSGSTWSSRRLHGRGVCFRTGGATSAYRPEKVVDGFLRPHGGPHLWMSQPMAADGEWLELRWPERVRIGELSITFNDDVNEHLINLHAYHTPFETVPNLVASYRIEATDHLGRWTAVVAVEGNRWRRRIHRFDPGLETERIRLVATKTNGAPCAEVIAISAYRHAGHGWERPAQVRDESRDKS
jgi:hypothetical protein